MKPWSTSYIVAFMVAALALFPVGVLFSLASDSTQIFDAYNLEVLANTLLLMAFTALGAILIGVPLAVILTYVQLPWKKFWLVLLAAPLAMPSYLGAFTFYATFGYSGELNALTGIETPPFDGLFGASVIMIFYTYPFVLLSTRAALSSLDASQVYAARTLGMSLLTSLWRIALPRIFNGIAAGALLASLYALSDFGTPAFMGLDTFTRVIYVEYNAFGLSQAAMLSLQLLVIVALVLYLEAQVKGSQEPPGRHLVFWPNKKQLLLIISGMFPIVLFAIVLPLAVFSIWLWRDGFGNFELSYAWNSAQASLLAAMAAMIIALPLAHASLKGRAGKFMERIIFVGFGIPGIVMGTALVYIGLQLPFLYQTLGLLVLAYLLRFLPLAIGSIRTATENLDTSMVNAARLLGASPQEAFRRVTLPLTMRGVIAGGALVFLEAMRELPATLLLGPTGYETLATYLWRVYEAGYFGLAAIPGLLLIFISALGLLLMLTGERFNDIEFNKETQIK
ncbi:iron ABC transporter permease [Thalassotalea sp. PP2-459]|uniref:ABC transporter permease n=1 Tax=Thalassotalea sp. PP2-459 TaxID=1742724 RepID=UPI0009430AC1|nr:iron ABC transporter permease [Thalassotalea sp. PP2-459]OKY26044.1 ABC transporter permease [Thalassotalea sp. PP2-459]